ncbi:carbonic anhydrase [Candidatus Micrarchaeota archaeon]|nr:carbonic anhydrase [Candidatus Micrarchaeota archaeon]
MNWKEALNRLMEGNKRFVENKRNEYDFKTTRMKTLNGQNPYVTIIACSDSRVVPEYIFDVDIGEIFKIETAGNIVGEISLGSVEYGVDHLKTPLLVILGHERCGAVTATCHGGEAHGHIKSIVEKIKPAADKTNQNIEEAVNENMKLVERDILERSLIVKKLVEKGELKILRIKYLLSTGEVKRME